MEIKASVLFFMLEKDHPVSYQYRGGDTAVSALRILDGDDLDDDTAERAVLYITDDPAQAGTVLSKIAGGEKPGAFWGDAFLLIGPASARAAEFAAAGTDAAAITEAVSPLKIAESLFSIVVNLQDWDLRLKDSSAKAEGYTELFKIAAEIFDFPVVLTNRNFTSLAYNQNFYDLTQGLSIDKWPIDVVSGLFVDKAEFYHLLESREPFLYPARNSSLVICCNIFKDNHLEGRLFAAFDKGTAHTKALMFLCARFREYVGAVFIKTADSIIQRKQQDLLHTLIRNAIAGTTELSEKAASAMLEESDWQIHDPFSVAVFLLPESKEFESNALYISRHLELDFPESCALIHESRIIWVVNNHMEQLEQLQNKKNNFLAAIPLIVREFNCKAGIAAPCSNFLDLPLAAVQAKAALRLGQKHDPDLGYYHFSAYTLDYIIDRIDGELPGECYYHPGLLSLLAYDQKHGTDFLKTLRCYIDANYNMAIAAERHFLHRATLYRRMERIQEITGINIENSNELLHISISLKLLGEKKGIKPQV